MLKQVNRLKKTRDFNLILKHGQWTRGRFLDIKYLKLAEAVNYFPKKEARESFKNQLKLAVVVGVKVSKSAVRRNRLKRQTREVVRLLLKDNQLIDGYYLMLLAKKEMLDKTYAEISEEVKVLLNKILKKY